MKEADNTLLLFTLINTGKRIKQQLRDELVVSHPAIPYELLSYLNSEGKTLKALSQLMRCSKQEISRLVLHAKENNWVELKPDPDDGRAKLVCYSTTGKASLKKGIDHYKKVENTWTNQLGEEKIQTLKTLLGEVNVLLNEKKY